MEPYAGALILLVRKTTEQRKTFFMFECLMEKMLASAMTYDVCLDV